MPEPKNKIVLKTGFCYNDYLKGRLFNDRVVVINGEIMEYTAEDMTLNMAALAGTSEPITVLITSYGGAVDAGTAVIRSIRAAQDKGIQVLGEVRGYAMSMATLILQACDVRHAAPEDIIMVHGFSGVAIGDFRNQEADLKLTQRLTEIYSKFFAERSTAEDSKYHDAEYWKRLLEDSLPHYYFGHEAYEIGLIDEVILPIRE